MEFRFLTNDFYVDYSHCVEMEKKSNRPYACLCLLEMNGLHFAIPIRHNITHPHAVFTNKEKTQGLDLSKAVIINDMKRYIDTTTTAFISKKEFSYLIKREYIIKKKMIKYINDYKKALSRTDIPKNNLLCNMSCLQYFHHELGI